MAIHQRGKLGVESALRPAHRLGALSARGIRSVLMQLDVRTIQVAELPGRAFGQAGQQPVPKPAGTPAAEPGVDRVPRTVALRQIPPRHTRAQQVPQGGDHQPIVLGRPPAYCAILPCTRFGATQLNFFSRRHNGSGNSKRFSVFIRASPKPIFRHCSRGLKTRPRSKAFPATRLSFGAIHRSTLGGHLDGQSMLQSILVLLPFSGTD